MNRSNISVLTVLVSLLGVGKVLGQEEFGQPVVYANNSATVMGQVTINGDPAGEGDVVAIYVGDELRGKQAVAINTGVAWLPNALINAKGGEETITFKVYDASAGVVVEKSATRPVIEPGKSVGTFTEPLLIKMDSKAPVITLLGEPEVQLELGSNYEDAGAQAEDNVDGDISNSIETVSTVDTNKPGTYTVTYNVEDSAGNAAATVTRLVEVLDPFGKVVVYSNNSATVLAQVSINGETAGEGDLVAIYVGDELRGKQVVAINVGVAWLTALVNAAGGEEEISFKVYDISAGEVLEKSGSTAVIEPGKAVGTFADPLLIKMDSVAPVITLLGEVEVSMEQGSEYEDAGATADDVVDGDLTSNIVIGGNLDVWKVGTYTVSYNVSDAAGNAAETVNRTVTVQSVIQTFALKSGWNLVSFYVETEDMNPATVLASIKDQPVQIKSLTRFYDSSLPYFLNTMSALNIRDGYWVKVNEDVSFEVEGEVLEETHIKVRSGWNLVGYPRKRGKAVSDDLERLGDAVVQIKNLTNSYDPALPGFLNTLTTMEPGLGYWLKVTENGTWTVGDVSGDSGNGRGIMKASNDEGPEWGGTVVYPNVSATVLAEVSVGGKAVTQGSVVGVYVGDELRGQHEVVLANGRSYATLNVNLAEAERVSYRIWDAESDKEYGVSSAMTLEMGETYGSAAALVKLDGVVPRVGVRILGYKHSPFGIEFQSESGRSYVVEATGDLKEWKLEQTLVGSGKRTRFTPKPKPKSSVRYFRVRLEE